MFSSVFFLQKTRRNFYSFFFLLFLTRSLPLLYAANALYYFRDQFASSIHSLSCPRRAKLPQFNGRNRRGIKIIIIIKSAVYTRGTRWSFVPFYPVRALLLFAESRSRPPTRFSTRVFWVPCFRWGRRNELFPNGDESSLKFTAVCSRARCRCNYAGPFRRDTDNGHRTLTTQDFS